MPLQCRPGFFPRCQMRRDGDLTDPKVSARALSRVVLERKSRGLEPLNFGMTFPFSHHNYQLRYWMAAGGVDPDEDVRLVVLPPPYMVESLASEQVDAILCRRALEFRGGRSGRRQYPALWLRDHGARLRKGIGACASNGPRKILTSLYAWCARSHLRANSPTNTDNRATVAHIVAQRLGVNPELVVRTLTGNLKTSTDGAVRKSDRYIVVSGHDANRPDANQAAWAYAQIVRWGQAQLSAELQASAESVFRADLYDSALGFAGESARDSRGANIGAFVDAAFDPDDIAGYLASWRSNRARSPRLSIVR